MSVIVRRMAKQRRRERRLPFTSRCALAISLASGRLLRRLPERFCLWSADRCADLSFALSRTYRAHVTANLRHVLRPEVAPKLDWLARETFRTSGRNALDLLVLAGAEPARLNRQDCRIRGDWAPLDEALRRGNGVVVVKAHVGAFDRLLQAFALRGYPLTIIVGRTRSRPVYDTSVVLRRALGVTVVEANQAGIRRTVEALRRGECVGFIADRDFFENGTPVDFFGCRTKLPSGAVRLARETGAPIVSAYLQRASHGFDLVMDGPFVVDRTADRQTDVDRGLGWVVASLEGVIAAAPGQWAVFQPVWPPDPAR